MTVVLDSCAMVAYLEGEPGGDVVDSLLRDAGVQCFAHSINLCEVYYEFIRRRGTSVAQAAIVDLRAAGVRERQDLQPELWLAAGDLKSRGRIALADCFCAALANHLGAEVVTSDRKEFTPIADAGLCRVRFIR